MAPRGWEPRRFAQPESLAQLPPPARARVTPGASLRPTARVVPGAAKRRVVPGSSLGRAPPAPPAKKAKLRQNGRALYASRADPNGPTRVEEDPDVRAGQARARRERGALDRALATSNASEAVAADRVAAADRAVDAAFGARAHAAGSCRLAATTIAAIATAVDALAEAEEAEARPRKKPRARKAAATQGRGRGRGRGRRRRPRVRAAPRAPPRKRDPLECRGGVFARAFKLPYRHQGAAP